MRKYVVNSANTDIGYAFYMPIVCLLWKRMGYSPIALLLGSRDEWSGSATKHILSNVELQADRVVFVNRVLGLRDSTTIQIARLFTAALNLDADDYILTSDVDMLPLNKPWFNQQDHGKPFNIWGADAYVGPNGRHYRFPICYLGAAVARWRELMGIRANLDTSLDGLDRHRDDWNYDEALFFERLSQSPMYRNCQFINRNWLNSITPRRIDRVAWNWRGQTDLIDVHCPRPGNRAWGSLEPVLKQYCGRDDFAYINAYRRMFT